ncbi:hypothetical protein SI855_002707 [Clostridioides difficile]|nr:hypothetical protein [Clostridioides difficile]
MEGNYDEYTAIDAMYANNENELKEKVDTWLKGDLNNKIVREILTGEIL